MTEQEKQALANYQTVKRQLKGDMAVWSAKVFAVLFLTLAGMAIAVFFGGFFLLVLLFKGCAAIMFGA